MEQWSLRHTSTRLRSNFNFSTPIKFGPLPFPNTRTLHFLQTAEASKLTQKTTSTLRRVTSGTTSRFSTLIWPTSTFPYRTSIQMDCSSRSIRTVSMNGRALMLQVHRREHPLLPCQGPPCISAQAQNLGFKSMLSVTSTHGNLQSSDSITAEYLTND